MTNPSIFPDAGALREMLHAARTRTLAYAGRLRGDQWLGPYLPIVNPPLWEIGHLGWFQEHWCLRYAPDHAPAVLPAPMMQDADALYNSATVAHANRWTLPLPAVDQTLKYCCDVYDAVLARLDREGATEQLRYFIQLAVFHEEMHNEAFDYTQQTLGYAVEQVELNQMLTKNPCGGDATIAGGRFRLGAEAGEGFVFDNEKWAHEVNVAPYRMARTAVSNAEFAAFVDDAGYARRELWSSDGWHWRVAANATAPLYWTRQGAHWRVRRHDRTAPLDLNAALIHVNWYEAEAYCQWAQRRLPTEAEWEFAAATAPGDLAHKRRYPWGDAPPAASHANLFGVASTPVDVHAFPQGDSAWGVRQLFGNVWEWTADWFNAYPGFVRDQYKEYSEPWFGNHKVLRGGCYATRASLLRNTWRNFYMPDRRDVLAGFRTCALD
jgi:gamma-glutamyl hercynylcysteine S-oxide synthase